MTQPASTTMPAESLDQLVADTPKILTAHDGRPLAAIINYELYLALQEAIEEWYASQRAAAAHAAWQADPSRGQDWDEFKAELVAEGLLDD